MMTSIRILARIEVLAVITLMAGLFGTAPTLEAGTLFGVRSNASESGLYRVDPATGEVHLIGLITAPAKTNFAEVSGIAVHPTSGALYAVGFKTPPFDHVLLTVDPATGQAAVVGRTNIESILGCREISDISFRSDGTLYAYADGCNRVGTLNLVTGALTLLGGSCVRGEGNGMAFSSADVLYHANDKNLNVIDQATGHCTVGPSLRFLAPGEDSCPGDQQVNAMAFDPETGGLFGVINCGNVVHRIATINTTTGDVEIDGTVGAMSAIAFHPQPLAVHPDCQINGTVQRIAEGNKNGQISAHLKCEAMGVGLRTTYARVTSLLRRDGQEFVFARRNDPMPLERVCLKQRSASDKSAKYEATIPETDRLARSTTLSITIKRKETKAADCVSGQACSQYEPEIRLDRATIADTSDPTGSCTFETAFEIVAGTLPEFDGACPTDEGLVVLGVSALAKWQNTDQGGCNPPKLRTPVR
jgi:hypothetical protein